MRRKIHAAGRRFVSGWIPLAAIALAVAGASRFSRLAPPLRGLASPAEIVQTDQGAQDDDVSTSQVEKYIAAYVAMQRDHSLNVEDAAAHQGMMLEDFRRLEDRISRNEVLRERVRRALRKAVASPTPSPSSSSK